ncbi:outer membrane beta-barrel protein [Cellvibrio japonicus]|uniref:OmpA-like transmembrane domain protein n=1 Tax=Cellvibrio japonicus (strain Ueda107) TaxID=498211 RepID=B3PHS0_CELJU|nr:outer membrane beta-barrel protein [Cellvibrio japonicus]ACE86183.1 OmpA-like transmembrane domain protein [Cellvibrio japonicus Ueda107]
MKTFLQSSLLMLACAIPATSFAGSDSGFYIGGSVGQSSLEAEFDTNAKLNEDDTAYKIVAGYNFGVLPLLDLGVEVDYRDFGKFKGSEAIGSADIVAVDLFGVAGLNFGPFGVFGKIGYSDADVDAVVENIKASSSESNMAYGIGAKFQLGSLALRAEYEKFDMDDVDDLSMFSVGATITF